MHYLAQLVPGFGQLALTRFDVLRIAVTQRLLQIGFTLLDLLPRLFDLLLPFGLQLRFATVRLNLAQRSFQTANSPGVALLMSMLQLLANIRFLLGTAFLGLGQPGNER